MSAKPTSLPIWATDPAAQVTEPNVAKKQQGHLGGEPLFGDYENWYKRLVFLWTEYLRDAVLAGVHRFLDAVQMDGTLTFAAGQHVMVSGSGRYRHGPYPLTLPGCACSGPGLSFDLGAAVILDNTTDRAFWTLPLFAGKRLMSYRVMLADNVTGATTVTFEVVTKTGVGTNSMGDVVTSAGTGAIQTLSRTLTAPITLAPGIGVALRGISSANNACIIHWVEFTFDDP